MKNLKLALKLAVGFGLVLLIALLLGGFAMWRMSNASTQATDLFEAKVPQVAVANNVERAALLTMYEIRGYGLSEDVAFLTPGLKHMEELKNHLKAAKELAVKHELAALKTAAEKAETHALAYEQLIKDTVANDKAIDANRAQMDLSAQAFMKVSAAYLDGQAKTFGEETKSNATMEQIRERALKMDLANDVIDAGNAVRLAAWRAQAERDPKIAAEAQKNFGTIKAKLDEMRPITKHAADLQLMADCQKAADGYQGALNELLKNVLARDEIAKKRAAAGNAVLAEAQATAALGLKETADSSNQNAQSLSTTSTILLVGLVVAVVFGVAVAFYMTRSIAGPIKTVATALSAGADETSAAAAQVSSSSQSLAEGASEQAASLEETSSSLEEISSMTKRNAEAAGQAKTLSGQTRAAADSGSAEMEVMKQAMDAIKTSATNIAKIVKSIDEIAFQTNILALNAAVEAARAGESGAGFAVVAEEVRALAQRSAQAAKETAEKIEDSVQKSEHGVQISGRVAHHFAEIVEKARLVDTLVGEIANASKEQTDGIEQVNTAVSQMDKVTQSNAGNAEETAAAAEELSAQSVVLQDSVATLLALVDGANRSTGPAATHIAQPGKTAGHKTAKSAAAAPSDIVRHPSTRHRSQETLSFAHPDHSTANGRKSANGDHFEG